ncbi:hypothetical protein [Hymenobacter metallilatus]|uniref:Lipoprotein n=1 Tax=Hymenobacter metallilatus TaxID=2493666 RepID=A0A3R9MNU6_9BACT|nr:hypothetical protein [Hymenobacter metallilatus]RSK37099.1 hypothetical protein EI290_00070 [Hymenobacter metallilatus]
MRYFYCFVFTVTGLAGCQKQTDVEPELPFCPPMECSDGSYVAGDVLVGMKETTMLPQALQLFNGHAFVIKSLTGTVYISALPADSIDYVIRELNRKSYINAGGWKAVKNGNVYLHFQTRALTVIPRLMDMTVANQQDWQATVARLQLQQQNAGATSCHLGVSVCSEKYWVAQMQQHNLVKWAQLNNIIRIQPGG